MFELSNNQMLLYSYTVLPKKGSRCLLRNAAVFLSARLSVPFGPMGQERHIFAYLSSTEPFCCKKDAVFHLPRRLCLIGVCLFVCLFFD